MLKISESTRELRWTVIHQIYLFRKIQKRNPSDHSIVVKYNGKDMEFRAYKRYVLSIIQKYRQEIDTYRLDSRSKLMIFLGLKCSKCESKMMDLLEIDHYFGGGSEEREWFRECGVSIWSYYWNNLEEANDKLQSICNSCHKLKTKWQQENSMKVRMKYRNLGLVN